MSHSSVLWQPLNLAYQLVSRCVSQRALPGTLVCHVVSHLDHPTLSCTVSAMLSPTCLPLCLPLGLPCFHLPWEPGNLGNIQVVFQLSPTNPSCLPQPPGVAYHLSSICLPDVFDLSSTCCVRVVSQLSSDVISQGFSTVV